MKIIQIATAVDGNGTVYVYGLTAEGAVYVWEGGSGWSALA